MTSGIWKCFTGSIVLILALGLPSTRSLWAQNCAARGASYFSEARKLNQEARVFNQDGVDKIVRNQDGSRESFRAAKAKSDEADRSRKLGYQERSECWKMKRATRERERKQKRSLWDKARKPLKKIMEKSWAANQSANDFQTLYDSRDDYRTQLSIISEKTQELNETLDKRSASHGASMISQDLTSLSIKVIERSAGNAIESFERSMARFQTLSAKYDQQKAKLRKRRIRNEADGTSRRRTNEHKPPTSSHRITSRQPKRSSLCPKGWSIQRNAAGQRFCRCGDTQYRDPKSLSDNNTCRN